MELLGSLAVRLETNYGAVSDKYMDKNFCIYLDNMKIGIIYYSQSHDLRFSYLILTGVFSMKYVSPLTGDEITGLDDIVKNDPSPRVRHRTHCISPAEYSVLSKKKFWGIH